MPSWLRRPTDPDARLRQVLDGSQLLGLAVDTGGRVVYANAALLKMMGTETLEGEDWLQYLPGEQRDRTREALRAPEYAREQAEVLTRTGEVRLVEWDHSPVSDPTARVSLGYDITERKATEERLRHGALADALTGLPNRNLFLDRLAGCIGRAKRRPQYRFAALFLDVDRFKVVNDSLGHQAGDELLVQIGERLSKLLRPGDSLARLGGDEFAILLDDLVDTEVPHLVAGRIQASLAQPFMLGNREVFLTVSIGTALNKPRYETPQDFMRDADTAMHHAKAQGKARHEVFETGMHTRAMALLQLENDLHRAVEREELSLAYQPFVSLKTGEVVGFEALLRWQRDGGFVPPLDFIRIAEETGLIVPMGLWVLREACRQLRAWQTTLARNGTDLSLSVNLSPRQFAMPDLVQQVGQVVRDSAVAEGSVKLEITESILMQDPEGAAAMLAQLRDQHVRICIDDFGTGYSSLSYLLRFPAHTLKIDRSFVSDLATGRQHAEMVRTIVALARNLGMDVIAEGVETEAQMDILRRMDCDYVQGFLVSRPLDATGAEAMLRSPSWGAPRSRPG
jgi:diguanylate cyclase (GGDEF)-like protein/PAS domain S-box-containing protein